VEIAPEAMVHLIRVSGGDARNALNALELAVETTPPDSHQTIRITLEIAQDSIQRRAVLYDKDGDAHYDTISAFIKSIRGSDPDAALYWLAKMLYAGEDPRFILRRLLILASEDIGLADPMALLVATSAMHSFEFVGLPEGVYPIVEATLYLATAPKSNSTTAYFKAYQEVERQGPGDVPDHLKDPNRDAQALGHGQGYQYPHSHPGHHIGQQYLPTPLLGTYFYQPSDEGYEQAVKERLELWRSAQRQALSIEDGHQLPDLSEEDITNLKRQQTTPGRKDS
jgi:putative ATPase